MSSFYEKQPAPTAPKYDLSTAYELNSKQTTTLNPPRKTNVYGNLTPPNGLLGFNKQGLIEKDEATLSAQQNLDDTIGKYTHILPYKQGSATNERRYQCLKCSKLFKRHEHLKRHIITHTGEKLFKCDYPLCKKKFSRSDEVKRHYKIHSTNTIENKILKQNKKKKLKEEMMMKENIERKLAGDASSESENTKKQQEMFKLVHETAKVTTLGPQPASAEDGNNKIVLPPIYQTPNSSCSNLNLFASSAMNSNTTNILPPLNNRSLSGNHMYPNPPLSTGSTGFPLFQPSTLTPTALNTGSLQLDSINAWNSYPQIVRPLSAMSSLNALANYHIQGFPSRPPTSRLGYIHSSSDSNVIGRSPGSDMFLKKTDSEKKLPSLKDILNL